MFRFPLLFLFSLSLYPNLNAQPLSFQLDDTVAYVQRWTDRGDSLYYSLDPDIHPWQPEAQVGWLFTDSTRLNQFFRRPDGRPLAIDFSRYFVLGWLDPAGQGRQLQLRHLRADLSTATISLQGFLQPARDSSRLQPALYVVALTPELKRFGPANCRFSLQQGDRNLFPAQDWHFPPAFTLADLRDLLAYYEAALAPEPLAEPASPAAPPLPPVHVVGRGYQLTQSLPLTGSNYLQFESLDHWQHYFRPESDAYPKVDESWFERYFAIALVKQGPEAWDIELEKLQRTNKGLRIFYQVQALAATQPGPQQAWHLLFIERGDHGPLSFRENGRVYATHEKE